MTLFSLADACRQLGIDAKTLRRWVTQAQVSVQPHPTDARLKGLTGEHLRLLATAHHRSLTALPEALPVLAPQEPPPQDVLATLAQLPAQLAAVQQQLTALTQLMQQPAVTSFPGPVVVASPALTRVAAQSRPMAARTPKPPPPSAHVLALVESAGEGHYVVICPTQGLLPFEPDTSAWFAWLATLASFRFVGQHGRLTAHREVDRLPRAAWRAHRSIRSHTYNLHLGQTEDLTIAVLEQAAAALHAHLA